MLFRRPVGSFLHIVFVREALCRILWGCIPQDRHASAAYEMPTVDPMAGYETSSPCFTTTPTPVKSGNKRVILGSSFSLFGDLYLRDHQPGLCPYLVIVNQL
jgi:hypothetical protein